MSPSDVAKLEAAIGELSAMPAVRSAWLCPRAAIGDRDLVLVLIAPGPFQPGHKVALLADLADRWAALLPAGMAHGWGDDGDHIDRNPEADPPRLLWQRPGVSRNR
jgi:hypothetical protein